MNLYYVETSQGCCIKAGSSLEEARKSALREVGTDNFESIRKATKEDITWVKCMGGYVPEVKEKTRKPLAK